MISEEIKKQAFDNLEHLEGKDFVRILERIGSVRTIPGKDNTVQCVDDLIKKLNLK